LAETPQRRASDEVDPRIIIVLREELADTRHTFRNEIAAVASMVQVGNLQQVTETAQMKAKLEEISSDVADLRREQRDQRDDFEPRLRKLEANDLAADKVSGLVRWTVGAAVSVIAVVIGAAAFLAQHIH
jgi:hypothetical protein